MFLLLFLKRKNICVPESRKLGIELLNNTENFLKKDYENFKKYIQSEKYPLHMDYLDYEIAPNLDRFVKSGMKGGKNRSYYSFLKKIGEDSIPVFSDKGTASLELSTDHQPDFQDYSCDHKVQQFLILFYLQ